MEPRQGEENAFDRQGDPAHPPPGGPLVTGSEQRLAGRHAFTNAPGGPQPDAHRLALADIARRLGALSPLPTPVLDDLKTLPITSGASAEVHPPALPFQFDMAHNGPPPPPLPEFGKGMSSNPTILHEEAHRGEHAAYGWSATVPLDYGSGVSAAPLQGTVGHDARPLEITQVLSTHGLAAADTGVGSIAYYPLGVDGRHGALPSHCLGGLAARGGLMAPRQRHAAQAARATGSPHTHDGALSAAGRSALHDLGTHPTLALALAPVPGAYPSPDDRRHFYAPPAGGPGWPVAAAPQYWNPPLAHGGRDGQQHRLPHLPPGFNPEPSAARAAMGHNPPMQLKPLKQPAGGEDGPDEQRCWATLKRPMNCFMIWSQTRRKELARENKGLSNSDISKKLGQEWAQLGDAERRPFVEAARELQVEYSSRLERAGKKRKDVESERRAAKLRNQQMVERLTGTGPGPSPKQRPASRPSKARGRSTARRPSAVVGPLRALRQDRQAEAEGLQALGGPAEADMSPSAVHRSPSDLF